VKKAECNGIWVFAEQKAGILDTTPLELLAKAVELKSILGEPVTAVVAGDRVAHLAETLIAHGADTVIAAENENLSSYSARPYEKVLSELCRKYKPSIFIFAATAQGRDLAPRVMCSLGTGLTADAVELGVDDEGTFVQTTPAFGGSLLAHISIPELRPQMVTVRAHVFDPLPADSARKGQVIVEVVAAERDSCYEVLEEVPKTSSGVAINDAEVLVSGGRGIKSQADLEALRTLASLMGGELACSRPLVDVGWLDHELQIGQSGTTVKPKFILNVGISGSVQYMVGMQKSEAVASINTYDRADILAISHYAAIADYSKLIPAIIDEIKARKGYKKLKGRFYHERA
jgi:electron transfer flavoprotein alpha subunit